MSENQFDSLMGALSNITSKVDGIEGRLQNIETELKRIEGWTPYNANQDIITKLGALSGRI